MINVSNLNKFFGSKQAVQNLSFTVEKGQVLGLIGPNGAGKSTTMRMISGFIQPSSGSVHLCGANMWTEAIQAKEQLGYLPESAPLFEDLTVEEYLTYLGSIRSMRGKTLKFALDRVIEQCFLSGVRQQSIDTLSKGFRHRVCLAQSLLHNPPIIIFDEPTDGLDPNQKHEIRKLIHEIRHDKAIILSTHILDEVDAVCTELLLMAEGKMCFHGTPNALIESHGKKIVALSKNQATEPFWSGIEASTLFTEQHQVSNNVEQDRDSLHTNSCNAPSPDVYSFEFTLRDPKQDLEASSEIIQLAAATGLDLVQIKTLTHSLDEVFRKITQTTTAEHETLS